MSRHRLIEDYLGQLRVLPAEMVDELADGLTETYDHHRAHGQAPDSAARAAITEFGTAEQILAAFDRIAPGRRTARALLATGPLTGLCWGTALISAHAWTWPHPAWAPPVLGTALLTVISLLVMAARGHRMRHAAPLGASGLILLDALAITGVIAVTPAASWPLRLAIIASLLRAYLTARALPSLLTR